MQSSILEANLVLSTLNPNVDGQSESTVVRKQENKVTKKRSKQSSRIKKPPKRTVKMINQTKLFNDKTREESSTIKTVEGDQMVVESVNTTNNSNKFVENIFHVHQDKEEELEDAVPNSPTRSTPPSKVAKTMFKKCFSSTFDANALPGHEIILVEDSGDEND